MKDEDKRCEIVRLDVRKILADGSEMRIRAALLPEHTLSLYVGGERLADIICTPDDLHELVVGRLDAEGLIERADDIAALRFSRDRSRADVELVHAPPPSRALRALDAPGPWERAWVFSAAARQAELTPLHSASRAAHSCMLLVGGEIRGAFEDVGRHNAMEKAIGSMLTQGAAPGGCMLYSSARADAAMVEKCIRAGVPLLAARGMPTLGALRLAEAYGLTLLFHAREDGFEIYEP